MPIGGLKNFRRVLTGINTVPFIDEITENDGLWSINTSRQDQISVQRDTNTIFLRAVDAHRGINVKVNEIQECITVPEAARFPLLMSYLAEFTAMQDAELQRAMIVRLKPGGRVYPHVDSGSYYAWRDRFHLVLKSAAGNELMCGGERAILQEGELWSFNNKLFHSAMNRSSKWRVHVIFDLLRFRDRRTGFVASGSRTWFAADTGTLAHRGEA
jgi:hypothetical protein